MTDQQLPPEPIEGDAINVHPLGEPEPSAWEGLDAAALDATEAKAERPLTDEERTELLAGLLEMPFAGAGWWLGRPHPQPLRTSIEQTWELPPASARRLAHTGFLAMPRSWRESRVLERLPLLVFGAQLVALGRMRLAATAELIDAHYQEAPDGSTPPEPLPVAGRRAARAPAGRVPRQPQPARAQADSPAAEEPGLGFDGAISARAAERRQRRRAGAAAQPAE